jgi:transposase
MHATTTTTVIGIDIGDKYSQLVEFDAATGETLAEGKIQSTARALAAMSRTKSRARVVLEAGGHSGWMSRELVVCGHEVFVANPRRIKLSLDRKSDRVDAEMLARIGRVDPKLLQPVTLRSEQTQLALATLRSRDALVKARTLLVNHIRAMVKNVGERLPRCSVEALPKRVDVLPESLRPILQPLMVQIDALTGQIRAFDRKIEEACATEYPQTERLRQAAHCACIRARHRRPGSLSESSRRGFVPRPVPSSLPIRRARSSAADHQGR